MVQSVYKMDAIKKTFMFIETLAISLQLIAAVKAQFLLEQLQIQPLLFYLPFGFFYHSLARSVYNEL